MEAPTLTDGAVLLRRPEMRDLDTLVAMCSDPEAQRWTRLPRPYTVDAGRDWLARLVPEGWERGDDLVFALCLPDGRHVGSVGLHAVDERDSRAEVGFLLDPAFRGRGLMPRAVRLACDWGFAEVGLGRIEWRAQVGNWSSRRVAEKVGFTFEGVQRGGLLQRGTRHDAWVAGLLPGEATAARVLPGPTLHTERLLLRPFEAADAAEIAAAVDDPLMRHWLPMLPQPYTERTARDYATVVTEGDRHDRTGVHWAVVPRDGHTLDGHRLAGSFSLLRMNERIASGEVGYWLAPWARGRGYATEAVQAIVGWGFETLELQRIELFAAAGNTASNAVAKRVGFRREGLLRSAEVDGSGGRHDVVVWSLLPGEQP